MFGNNRRHALEQVPAEEKKSHGPLSGLVLAVALGAVASLSATSPADALPQTQPAARVAMVAQSPVLVEGQPLVLKPPTQQDIDEFAMARHYSHSSHSSHYSHSSHSSHYSHYSGR